MKTRKVYMTVEQINKIGATYKYGSMILDSTKNKIYKDEKGYYIKKLKE